MTWRGFAIALSYWQGLPFADDSNFGGEKHFTGWTGEPRVLVGWRGERWRVAANFGFLWHSNVSHFLSTAT